MLLFEVLGGWFNGSSNKGYALEMPHLLFPAFLLGAMMCLFTSLVTMVGGPENQFYKEFLYSGESGEVSRVRIMRVSSAKNDCRLYTVGRTGSRFLVG
jgi:hypothetical protein